MNLQLSQNNRRRKVAITIITALFLLFPMNSGLFNASSTPAAVISTTSGTGIDDKFGWNVSDCGDVNGDGIEDVIVGAPGYNSDSGRAYIFFGGSGFVGDMDADSADVILEGSWAGAQFGWDVSGAGDFNGDGLNDTIVGAPKNNSNTGAAYIFYGSISIGGIISSDNASIIIDGENSGDLFGSSVSDLGDVSKKPPVDHIVISEVYANAVDETSPNIGEYLELYNPTSAPVLLDNWIIEDMDSHSFTISGTIPAYGFFLIAIDNYLASTDPTEASWPAPDFDCGYTAGSIFANAGDEIRLKDDTDMVIDTFGYTFNAEWYEGAYHPALPNPLESYERKLGETVPNGGNAVDTNNNGNDFAVRSAAEPQNTFSPTEVPPNQSIYDDVIVGAYGYGNDRGRAYVFYGSSADPIDASYADVILTGKTDNDLFGFSVSKAGDVNSDGFDDILIGAPGVENKRGQGFIYYGRENMSAWSRDIEFAHWDEYDGAVLDPGNVYAIYEKRWLAQSFTPDNDYLLTKLWLYLDNTGTTTISISLEGDNGGPDGMILAQANPKSNNPPGPNPLSWVEFEFSTPFEVTAGTMYWIVARATGKNTNNCWGWLQDLDSIPNYNNGYSAYVANPPGTWIQEPDYDYWFKAFGRLPREIKPDVVLTGDNQGDLFGWSVSDAGDIGGDGIYDIIMGAPGTANGNAYIINGSTALKDVTASGIGWGVEKRFTNWEMGGDMEPAIYTGQDVAQSFIPQYTYLMTNVSILIKTFGTPGTLTVKLMGSAGSAPDTVPDGVVLAQANSISTGNVTYEWTQFEWLVPYTCTAGIEYFIVAEGTGTDTTNCWGWFGQRGGSYPDGDSAYNQGGGWIAYDADLYFSAFGKSETALPNITLEGESPGDMFGYSVSGAGNFNGDAFDDVIVGAPGNGNGKVYLFNCSDSIPFALSAAFADYDAIGEGGGDYFGWSVSYVGDVNQTLGYNEVIAGAPFHDPSGLGDAGKAYILSMPGAVWVPPPDLPFRIDNDAEFATMAISEGWVGDGSSGNPYIINNYMIDGGGYGYCIYIGNTTVSFIISNCKLYNSSGNAGNYFWNSGIGLYNVSNGTLIKNTFENSTGDGLHIVGSTKLTINQNYFLNSSESGVYLESATENTLGDNTFDNNNYGVEMNSNSDYNFITRNQFTNNSEALDLWSCDNNIISNNIGDENVMFAYFFSWCEGNEFLNNTITGSITGIYLQSNCNGNTFKNNTISDITQEGFIIESSNSNTIESNDIQKCRYGIYSLMGSLNTISNNTLSNNTDYGIFLDSSSDQNTISNNTIAENGYYGILMISTDFNIIIYNDIINNILYGINATSTTNDNEIHHNTISDNNGGDVQARDDGTNNIWDDGKGEGNLWGDYEKHYVPPATSNGKIWDIPYDTNGSAGSQDRYPLALYVWYQDLRIDNNSDFADTAAFWGWAGDGSGSDPYVIEGLTLDVGGLGYGIYIGNTTMNFIIRNCSIENSTGNSNQYFRNSGIYLFNVTKGVLENNDIKACNGNGINIEYSMDIIVTDNTVRYNNQSGIYIGYYSNITIENNACNNNSLSGVYIWSTWDLHVRNNTCMDNQDGITIEWTNNISIIDNTCINNSDDGIYVMNSEYNSLLNNTCVNNEDGFYLDQSNNITVVGNECNNNSDDGIAVIRSEYISLYNNTCVDNEDGFYISTSEYNMLFSNICLNNSDDGIALSNAYFNTVINNTSMFNFDGIWLNNSHNNTMENNICNNNSDGFDLDLSHYNTLFNNNCNDNIGDGIDLNQSCNNTLVGNDCNNNDDNGIEISSLSNNNTICNNTITGNADDGIFIEIGNSGGLIENNTISENGENGINLTFDSDNFGIINNNISNNSKYGILIFNNDCENNLIHHNGFYNNNAGGVQAYDNGSNTWDNGYPSGGNFWSDYIGVDFNSTATQDVPPPDGFGDAPYDCDGPTGAQDRYPLITFPWTPPPITGLPEISDVTALPDPQETGGFVNVTCNITDAEGVSEVWLNFTLPTGINVNVSMAKGAWDEWFDNSLYSILGTYDYVIWAKDVTGIWNSSSVHSFTIQDTTLPFIFNVQNAPNPQQAGSSVNISCEVTDNVGVAVVWVNISLPGGGFKNVSMIKGAGDEWFYESVYNLLGGYSYTIWANDSSGNWDISFNNNFQILDSTSPTISNVLDYPDPQLPGGSVNITCEVADNLAVYFVWINITLPGAGYTNTSMTKGSGDGWYLDSVYIPLGIYDYTIWANDTENNWASSSGHTFTIEDGNSPVISNVLDNPDPQEIGGFVNIICDVTDDVGVSGVWINITYPGGGYNNISMNKGILDAWYYDSTYTTLGIYSYVIWANDTNGNWVSSAGHQFTIRDSTPPVISNVQDIPDPQEVNQAVNISCDVTDNTGVIEVWVNITLPGGGINNVSMLKGVGNIWYLESPFVNLGIHDYVIWANDASNNWESSSGYQFSISDSTFPIISNVLDIPDPQEVNGAVNISCDATDNFNIYGVWVNISLPGGGHINTTLERGAGDRWFYESTYSLIGPHDYIIWANDTSDNWVASSGHSFIIQDITSPLISNVIDTPDPQECGMAVNVSCDVTDNFGVLNVWINITLPGGGYTNSSMTKGLNDKWYYDTSYFTLGIFDYVIWASDSYDNWAGSSGYSFSIQDNTPPEISNVNANPDPQLINSFVNLSCDVTDAIGVYGVWVNITRPDGSWHNISLENGMLNKWFNEGLYTMLGTYNYLIWVSDTSGNWNCSTVNTFVVQTDPPFNIILISGNGQSGAVGTQLASPLVVEVQDLFGNLVPDAIVWFNITSGGGSLDAGGPILTDTNGRGQTNLSLGLIAGANTITAEIAGEGVSQVTFIASGIPGAPYDIVLVSGDGQTGEVDALLSAPFVIEVLDMFGNPVSNADVWFNISLGNGALDISNPQKTDILGRLQANLTLGTTTGQNMVSAEIASSGLNQVIFSAVALPGAPHDLIIISGNGQSDSADSTLPQPLVVEVTDQFGNPIPNIQVCFNVTEGGGFLDIQYPVLTNATGRAQVNLTLGPNAGSNSVSAEIVSAGTNKIVFTAQAITNKPEIISPIDNILLAEDDPPYNLYLFASAVDDEDMPSDLRWHITDYDSSLYTVSGQGTNIIVITPKNNMYGSDEVVLWVTDSSGQSNSQVLWINITPLNDKPFYFPEPPDLTVTKDVAYTFNYAPYILDIDNSIAELLIITDDPDHTAVSGNLVTYVYPSSMLGQQALVTLTLSDGLDSSQTVIKINISEDNVPVLTKELPDVWLFEGESKYNVFNLDDYFYDPDGDAVFFSYGYSRINIIINENHSVDFIAEGDWYGEETVTFRARDPSSAISEDTILVRVIPVNDPPMISDVPDLVVHYDSEYVFDLSPYIFDADNATSDLILSFMETLESIWLISQHVNVTSQGSLKISVNYPQMYLGSTFKVKIVVFDGVDFTWQEINITVSENWQPELVSELPDIVFYEDEYVSSEFNLYDHFADRDGDALFFSYGQKHVQVKIHPNGSIDFTADENWYGTENITIRASDSSGAIVEDIITVSVLPVNDPPVISPIPNQEGFVGVTWVLDLSPYIHDNDNNITELIINCDSPYVTVVGAVLVFQYPGNIKDDTVQIVVRDPNNANSQSTFNVVLKEPPESGLEESDIFSYIWLFIIIVIILVTILLYAYLRGRYTVEEVLLVYRNKGILIAHINKGQEEKMDRDLMTGMFTAIQDFVGDVFESEGKDTTQLKEMELGDKKVLIEHGQYTYIAAVFKGGAKRLVPKLSSVVMELETEFIDVLEEWDGEIEALEGVDIYLNKLV